MTHHAPLSQLGPLLRTLANPVRALIVTDATVAPLHLPAAQASLRGNAITPAPHILPPGESTKDPQHLLALWQALHHAHITRTDCLIALGGGVVGDLAGFAAATWLRGIPLVHVPTTLLAQVDSSIGGKTAINLPFAKNPVGAFHPPLLTLIDPSLLQTLPPAQLADGLAEVIKYALIRDPSLLPLLHTPAPDPFLIVPPCVRIKTDLTTRDPLDTADRLLLNFGHTLGHALETLTHHTLSHGQAISIGMVLALRLGQLLRITPPHILPVLLPLLRLHHLPTTSPIPPTQLLPLLSADKKNLHNHLHLILLQDLGHAIPHPLPLQDLPPLLNALELEMKNEK